MDAASLAESLKNTIDSSLRDLQLDMALFVTVEPIPVTASWAVGAWLAVRWRLFSADDSRVQRWSPPHHIARIAIGNALASHHRAPGVTHPVRLGRQEAIDIAKWIVAIDNSASSGETMEASAKGDQTGWIIEVSGPGWARTVVIPAGEIDRRRIMSIPAARHTRETTAPMDSLEEVATGRQTVDLDEGEVDAVSDDLIREINESLAELGLDAAYRFGARPQPSRGLSSWWEITWQLMGVVGSGVATSAAYEVAKYVVLRRLAAVKGALSGAADREAMELDEARSLARWCLSREYSIEPGELRPVGEQRTKGCWIIELQDSASSFRVKIPTNTTKPSQFEFERQSLC